MFRRKKPNSPKKLTGVVAILSASHRDQKTGQIHGHTWEVTAWFKFKSYVDQSTRKWSLDQIIKPLDHTCIPDAIAWGENFAEYVANELNGVYWPGSHPDSDCVAVDVRRPSERIYARWEA